MPVKKDKIRDSQAMGERPKQMVKMPENFVPHIMAKCNLFLTDFSIRYNPIPLINSPAKKDWYNSTKPHFSYPLCKIIQLFIRIGNLTLESSFQDNIVNYNIQFSENTKAGKKVESSICGQKFLPFTFLALLMFIVLTKIEVQLNDDAPLTNITYLPTDYGIACYILNI